jgi:hypothetical protein
LTDSPRAVAVDIYVINIGDVDQATGSYGIDMYLSFAWNGTWSAATIDSNADNNNGTSASAFPIHFEFTNGVISNETLIEAVANINDSGYNYLSYRVQATFSNPFDFQKFPLDQQILSINIEDALYDNNTLVYVSDNQSMFDPGVQVAGWVVLKNTEHLSITNHVYDSSFGYPGAPQNTQSAYSHVEFSIIIARPLSTAVLTLALPIIVLVTLAMLSFKLTLNSSVAFDKRIDIGVLSLFAAVGFLLALDSGLPAGSFTLADDIMVLAFAILLYSNILTVSCHKFDPKNPPKFIKDIDRVSFIATPVIVIVLVTLLIIF